MGSSVENLDSKKPPPRLVLSNYVLGDFVTYPYQPYRADFYKNVGTLVLRFSVQNFILKPVLDFG